MVSIVTLKCMNPVLSLYDRHTFDILISWLFVCNCCWNTRVERIYDDINDSITRRSIPVDFRLNKLALVVSRVTALMGILVCIHSLKFLHYSMNVCLSVSVPLSLILVYPPFSFFVLFYF